MIIDKIDELIDKADSLLGVNTENINLYEFCLFYKEDYLENDIFKVYNIKKNKNNRLGWIFPIYNIASTDHKFYFDSKFDVDFKTYANIAKNIINENKKSINQIDNIHILIVKKERLKNNNIYSINNIFPSIYKYGYYIYNDNIKINNKVYKNFYTNEFINEAREKEAILIKKIILDNDDEKYLIDLYSKDLLYEYHYYLRFMLLYQIVELLLERYFIYQLDKMKSKRRNIGSFRERIQEFTNERKIINIVFNELGIIQITDTDLTLIIKDFFKDFKDEDYFTSPDYIMSNVLYDIRNNFVHNYYKFNLSSDTYKKLIDKVELLIIELLESWSEKNIVSSI